MYSWDMENTKVVLKKSFQDAHELLDALTDALSGESGILYVEGPDAMQFNGFSIVEETLTDGSLVRNLVLAEEE